MYIREKEARFMIVQGLPSQSGKCEIPSKAWNKFASILKREA